MYELTIHLQSNSRTPLYLQLYNAIKSEIHARSLTAGTKLPSKRKLAQHLGISTLTVENAYGQLKAEGYLVSKPRQGLYVEQLQQLEHASLPAIINQHPPLTEKSKQTIDFHHGRIDTEHFPHNQWRKATLEALNNQDFLDTGNSQGEQLFRQEMVVYLFQSRGVRCSPEQIIIGAGTQHLLLLLTTLFDHSKDIAFEEPGFHRSKKTFKQQGFQLSPITLDQEGINLQELKQSSAKLAYVTPSHQFPTGVIMSISRRQALLNWAKNVSGYVVEDDYDGEFRFKGRPIPSLQGIDTAERVIYLGTFSKSLIPSARMSYMILPNKLLRSFQQLTPSPKQSVSRFEQNIFYHFMKKGYWERHLNKMRTVYRRKYEALTTLLRSILGKVLAIIGDPAGLHLLLEINTHLSEKTIEMRAEAEGVRIYPASIYYEKQRIYKKPVLLLGFGGLTIREIETGIAVLKEISSEPI
ncbi:LOW QUALITY PROTEIN: transcriptional regulator of pyridoxine metabolism [Bacillus sp. JCM 19046]|nr:LOW QUALITY PROTEIN: transcriptional regulator of pyridoxine metabolism [Bacillus sp. JCM 19045]GAF20318.1 LOW QUALITY PROTEIN: transcriptional regulator of pyridoxine metabolism [Bacillus sp. JCM 19046]